MASVKLLDGNRKPVAASTRFVSPNTFDLWNTGAFELAPDSTASVMAEIVGVIVGWYSGHRPHQNRVITMQECLNTDRGLLSLTTGIIAGPFTERSFSDGVVWIDLTLKCDLCVGRHWKTRLWHIDNFHGFAKYPPCSFVFVFAIWDFEPGQHKHGRMYAKYSRNRTGLAALMVLFHDKAAMLSWRNHEGRRIWFMRLNAVGSVVYPIRIRILHYHHTGGADKWAAVVLVPNWGRDRCNIHIGTLGQIVEQWTTIDLFRRNGRGLTHILTPPRHQVHVGSFGGQT